MASLRRRRRRCRRRSHRLDNNNNNKSTASPTGHGKSCKNCQYRKTETTKKVYANNSLQNNEEAADIDDASQSTTTSAQRSRGSFNEPSDKRTLVREPNTHKQT